MADERVEFEAIIPSTVTAIRIHGDEGMRFQLDVDESNLPAALGLLTMRGRLLKITVELAGKSWTNFDNATEKGAESGAPILDRRRGRKRRAGHSGG